MAKSRGRVPIEAAFDAISRMDADALVSLCDPEVEFESRITALEDASYTGHDGVRRYIANLADAFEFIHAESSEVVEADGRAVITNGFRARGRGAGVELEQRFFVAGKAREGQLVWWGFFDTRGEALDAVGLEDGNLQLAHRVIDAVEDRDAETLVELTHSDVEWRSAFVVASTGSYAGHDGIREYVRDMQDAWDIVRLEIDHEIAVGGVVVFVGRIHYRGKGSGVESESESGYVLRFRDAKLISFRPFRNPEAALAAVGL